MSIWKTKKENPIIEKEGLYLTFSKEMGTRLLYFQKDKKLYLMCIDEYCLLDDLLNQQAEIDRLKEAIRLARDTAYQSTQDCPRCGFIVDLLTKTLNEGSEGK